jgi:hypothetical protein
VVVPLRVSLKQLYTGDILEMTYARQVSCDGRFGGDIRPWSCDFP